MLDGLEYVVGCALIAIFMLGFIVAGLLFALLHYAFASI